MTSEEAQAKVRSICLALPLSSETQERERSTYAVNNSIFATYGGNTDYPMAMQFRPDDDEIETLMADVRTLALSQLTRDAWLAHDLSHDGVDWSSVERLIRRSYNIAASMS